MSVNDKNIIIYPNVGSATDDPKIVFSAANTTANAQNITLRDYPTSNGTLSFEGSAGQLFSVTNQLTGTLFSVNDISGIPSIEVLDTGRVNLAQYNGSVVIGANTSTTASNSNTTGELVVYGGVGVTGNIYVGGTNAGANGIYTDVLRYAANGLPWVMNSGSGGGGGGGTGTGNANTFGWLANTIIVANSAGYLSNSNSFFVASNNAIVVPNVVITQVATASWPLNFGQNMGNKIALYDSGSGSGYGFGIQANKLQIIYGSGNSGDHTSFGYGPTSSLIEQFRVGTVLSSVNYLQVTGNTSGNPVAISAQGSDTNLDINITTKGNGKINFFGGNPVNSAAATPFKLVFPTDYSSSTGQTSRIDFYQGNYGFGLSSGQMEYITTGGGSSHTFFGNSVKQFVISTTASAVNYLQVTGATTTNSPILSAQGSNANVAINLVPKGNAAVMITGNTTGIIAVANSIYVGDRVGYANANNISVVYQSYNSSTNSLDVVFG